MLSNDAYVILSAHLHVYLGRSPVISPYLLTVMTFNTSGAGHTNHWSVLC